MDSGEDLKPDGHIPIAYDLSSHHALGGGSYVFKSDYLQYLKTLLPAESKRTEFNIIIRPNSSPHVGTLCSLGLAFIVARRLQDLGKEVMVRCDLWDRAKGEQYEIGGIKYQRSLRDTGRFQQYLPDYTHILQWLANKYAIEYRLRFEEEFLQQQGMPAVLQKIVKDRSILAMTVHAFPSSIHITDIQTDAHRIQFNCQLYNLVMGLFYEQVDYGWIEICGSDYARFWQEQLLWRFLSKPVVIVYTPLISDWSDSKVSKSLYLQETAYDYLRRAGQEYLLSYEVLRREGKDLNLLWEEIERWVNEPYRLFLGYSLHYLHLLFNNHTIRLGII